MTQVLVLDADALTVFHDDPGVLRAAVRASQSPVVVTPHEGEFKKIFPHVDKGSRLNRACYAAEWLHATVVYKGPDTVVASPDGRATITAQAEPWLATAGSGDVLAGVIGALLAGGADPFSAGCAGVWIHAEASRRFGPGMIAEDLITAFPDILVGLS
ncbi:MAG: NAD(P)H-hydrate dehydratase [Alphaproteobacteria bacterium]|nr:NAD(P)H-hydrate dehydratase [Alphaproteobacteria bacterium]